MLKNDENLSEKKQAKVLRLFLHLKKISFLVVALALFSIANQALAQTPQMPVAADFNVEANANQVIATWTRLSNIPSSPRYVFSVEDENGNEVLPPATIDTNAGRYSSEQILNLGTSYILKIVASTELNSLGTISNSAPLNIAFTTRQTLPSPTQNQIRFSVTANIIRVHWNNVPAEVEQYEIKRILGNTNTVQSIESVNLAEANFITFSSLSEMTSYTISIVSSGDDTKYKASAPYEVNVNTDSPNQLGQPFLRLSVSSTRDITVAWDGINGATTYTIFLYKDGALLAQSTTSETTVMFDGSAFNLEAATFYRIEATAVANGMLDSTKAIATIMTPYRGTLTQATRLKSQLRFDRDTADTTWDIVPNADNYNVRLYEDRGPLLDLLLISSTSTTRVTTILFSDLNPLKRYRVGIIAQGEGYLASDEIIVDVAPALPPANDFGQNLYRGNNNVVVNWDRIIGLTSTYSGIHFVFSITDSDGRVVVAQREIPTTVGLYESGNVLFENTDYTLNAFSRINSSSVVKTDSATISVPFRTRTLLLAPTPDQITLNVTPDSVEIIWNNPPPDETSRYDISISSDPGVTTIVGSLDATVEGAEIFALNRELVYTLSIASTNDESSYISSAPYIISLALNRGDEIPPVIALDTNVGSEVTSRTSTTLVWEAATDLAGSIRDINNDPVNRTRPNSNNISYEIIITDITLGAINPTVQVESTGVLKPTENTVSFTFNPNLELGHIYRASITAFDDAGLMSTGTYTGTFPPVTLPIILNEEVIVQNRAGTSVLLNWLGATETVGSGPVEGSNDTLVYQLIIEDVSSDASNLQTATTMQTVMTKALPPHHGRIEFALNRGNSVLIPGREYEIKITAFNSLMQESTNRYTTGRFSMALAMDTNNNNIEDSLERMVTTNYCGGTNSGSAGDSDGDGISNGLELKIGTDCRMANQDNDYFYDNNLRLGGLVAPTVDQITLDARPDSVIVSYTPLIDAPLAGNTEYVISSASERPFTRTTVSVDPTTTRRQIFSLNRDVIYTISVRSVNNLYLDSMPYTIELPLNRGDEILPIISSKINVESIVTSRTSTTLIWEAATDLAGSVIDRNNNPVDRTRPNSKNIAYEITITDITLGVTNPIAQVLLTGVLNPEEDSTVVLFTFDFNLELGHIYRANIIAIDNAGLRSVNNYTGTFPPVSRPFILDEEITVQERTGTRIILNWRSAYEVMSDINDANGNPACNPNRNLTCGSNSNLIYELTIVDISDNVPYLETPQIEQTVRTGVLRPQNNMIAFTLDRNNIVLIPGRDYMVEIYAFNSLMQASTKTYRGLFGMATSTDANGDGIEDSLDNIINGINNINTYCGINPDADDDGISNTREVETGTDCRPTTVANFNDNGLTLDGVVAPTLTVYRIGGDTFDSIADIYTVATPILIDGLVKLENDSFAMTTCSNCTVTPLLAVANDLACTRLSNSVTGNRSAVETDIVIDNGYVGNALCQVRNQIRNDESVYLPLGFSTIVWKVEDLSGNVIQERQLYYVAPEISISPAEAYVQRNLDGTLNDAMVKLNVNAGQIGNLAKRYASGFDGTNIEGLDSAKFLLDNNIIMPILVNMETNRGVAMLEYQHAIDADLETATLSLDTADVISITDTLSPANYQIDRDNPATYAYRIGNTTQALTVIDRPIEVEIDSRLDVSSSESKLVISVTTATDTRGGHTVFADVLYRVDGSEKVMPLVAQGNGNTTTFDLVLVTEAVFETSTSRSINEIATSESSATRVYIKSNEDESVIWERYCAYSAGANGFCNIDSRQSLTASSLASLTASSIPYRPDGRYASSLALSDSTAPVEATTDAIEFAGVYSSFPVIEFNADTISRGQLTPTIALVIKLSESIPSAGGYLYKYIDRTLGDQDNPRWNAFFEGEGHGRLYSATEDTNGNCPAIVLPSDSAAGLTRADGTWGNLMDTNTQQVLWHRTATTQTMTNEGVMEERLTFNMEVPNSSCILIWITDGGRNDADVVISNEVPNGIISDPVRLGAPALPPAPCPSVDAVCNDTTSNGGAISKSLLFLLMLTAGVALIQRRKKLLVYNN